MNEDSEGKVGVVFKDRSRRLVKGQDYKSKIRDYFIENIIDDTK